MIDEGYEPDDFSSPLQTDSDSDPCGNVSFSSQRLTVFTVAAAAMGVGAVLFFVLFPYPFCIQLTSAIYVTGMVTLYTFSSGRGLRAYSFDCPVVRRLIPRFVTWHVGFLVALFVLETLALTLLPFLPGKWHPAIWQGVSPYAIPIFAMSVALAVVEVSVNRMVMGAAH